MKTGVCTLLIMTQVLLCTVGQGALSLCVKTDGTQKVQWTFAKACGKKSPDKKVCSCCGAKKLDADSPNKTGIKRDCHSCQDFILIAENESISNAVKHQPTDDFSRLATIVHCISPFSLTPDQVVVKFDSSQALPNSLSTIVSTVVIRC